jgi:hypothetical protein
MRKSADGGGPALPKHRNDDVGAVVSELAALLDHVQASITIIETVVARDIPGGNPQHIDNAVILDDVTPRYAQAVAALSTCRSSLEAALRFLHDAEASTKLTGSMPRLVRPSGPS